MEELERFTEDERCELIPSILRSDGDDAPAAVPPRPTLTPEQWAEVERRDAAVEAGLEKTISLQEFRAERAAVKGLGRERGVEKNDE